jgi:hypothetical protein
VQKSGRVNNAKGESSNNVSLETCRQLRTGVLILLTAVLDSRAPESECESEEDSFPLFYEENDALSRQNQV